MRWGITKQRDKGKTILEDMLSRVKLARVEEKAKLAVLPEGLDMRLDRCACVMSDGFDRDAKRGGHRSMVGDVGFVPSVMQCLHS